MSSWPDEHVSVTDQHVLATVRTLRPDDRELSVLEVGCGDGTLLAYLVHHWPGGPSGAQIDAAGFDVVDSMTEPTDFPASTLKNLERLVPGYEWESRIKAVTVQDPWPFDDESMDVVVSNQVLEHVFDYDHFFAQLWRVLKPGGTSVHVLPLRRQLFEFHLSMPFVHRVTDHGARAWLIEQLTKVGWGTYRDFEDQPGMSRATYAETRSDFIDFGTYYPTWRVLVDHAKTHRLRIGHRFTRYLYVQRLQRARRQAFLGVYPTTPSPLRDVAAFAVLPYLATITITLDKPAVLDSWRRPPPV